MRQVSRETKTCATATTMSIYSIVLLFIDKMSGKKD